MVKNIKKSFKIIIIITGVLILLPILIYISLQFSEVQTFVVKRITSYLSNEIKSVVSIGKVEYSFFNNLTINDLLIEDQNNDTLLYSKRLTAGIKRIDIRNKSFRLGRITLIQPVVKFITDTTGTMNLTWYLDILNNSSASEKSNPGHFFIDQVDISDARFSLINHTGIKGKTKIDFNNLNLTGINGIVEDIKIDNDTMSFNIYNLGLKEAGGFLIKRMNSSVVIADKNILCKSLSINCDSTILNISSLGLSTDSSGSFKKFTEDVKLDIQLDNSLINTTDLQYFVPFAKDINETVWLSGRIFGTISELRGRNIDISYRDYTNLKCDFDLSGLPKIENAFIYIGVSSLKTNAKDLDKITIPGQGPYVPPEIMYKLGNITFDGSFTGFITDFVTYGKFRTNLGNIQTDISLRPEESKKFRIQGLLTGNDIDIGVLSGNTQLLGKLSMKTNIDGFAYSFKKFAASLTGKIDSVEINKYIYRNVALNGSFTEKTWDGNINITDKNIKLDLLGLLNFEGKLPVFNFTLNIANANLYKLNFDRLDTTSEMSILLTSNIKGNSIDNLDGEIKLLNSSFKKFNNNLTLNDFSIRTHSENNMPVLSLRTDFVDADIKGHYNFAAIGVLVKSTLATLMPSQFQSPLQRNELKKNNFSFDINFKNTDKINSFFRTGLLLAENSYIIGTIFPDSTLKIDGKAKFLTIKSMRFDDFSLDADVSGSESSVVLNSSSLTLLGQSELKGFTIDLKTKPDNFIFKVIWDNKDEIMNKGNFIARGKISKSLSGKGNSILNVDIDSTDIYARNNLWKISHSVIIVDSNAIKINKLLIRNNEHFYLIDGAVSDNPADTLNLEFNGIDIAPLNYIINKNKANDPTAISLNLKGFLNGKILLTNVYNNLLLESDIVIHNLSLLGSELGNTTIISAWNNAKKVVKLNLTNNLAGLKILDIDGIYDPATSKIELSAKANKLPLDFLNPLLDVFASDISGTATGDVILSGYPENFFLQGALMVDNASIKIDYLQTKYKLNDTVKLDKNGIKFDNVRLVDEKGNSAILSGSVNHKNFRNFSVDLIVNAKECMVLNTKPKDNPLFYGTAYASGVTTIKTGLNSLSFDISAKTGKNTKFFIPLNGGLSVSEYSFVSFIDSASRIKGGPSIDSIKTSPETDKQTGLDLNFDLEVTPDAEVQIIYDSKVGDVMKGRGSGNLNITYDNKGVFKMSGDYIIEDGDYLFTLGNFLNKPFRVENGGKIMFNGDLDNAELDVNAIYKLKASLYEILQDESYKERTPVECQLNLTGKLFNPVVGFNIYLPTADEKTRTALRNAISTEEELSRQFAYLLVMNSFYTSQTTGSAQLSTASAGTSAMAVTTFEMLSSQLSNWFSQISNDFDIGVNYRPGYSAMSPQEVQVALSTQLLNDKVVINSNFDVRGSGNTTNTTNPITGDFDIEYKITEKIRFKVFNRFNNPYTGRLEPYTQGIGIFFNKDFNKFSDFFKKKVKSDMKKEDETTVKKK
jgi:hypothetical protein